MSEANKKGGMDDVRLGERLKETRDTGVYRFFEKKTPTEIVTNLVDERKVGQIVKDRLYQTAEVFADVIKQVQGLEALVEDYVTSFPLERLQATVGAVLRQLVLLSEDYERELNAKEKAMEGLAQKLSAVTKERLEDIRQKKELYLQIMTDPMTGLYSRRFFFTDLPKHIKQAEKHDEPLSVIVYDVNNFKKANDLYGHDAGDFVLKELAKLALNLLPKAYVLARIGGDEFAIIVPKATEQQAYEWAEKLRIAVKNHSLIYTVVEEENEFDYKIEDITIALGVKQYEPGESADELYRGADAAFYVAHKQGKNKTVKYSDFEQHIKRMPADETPRTRPEPIAVRQRKK
ncbi:MAG: GGDEF domain-containing protein [Candidatus Woesearchaeota archaeon]